MDRLELQAAVVKKSLEDAAFREMFLKDPKDAIKKEFGIALADHLIVNVVEENPSTMTLYVPPVKSELSDDDLADVAGGFCILKTDVGCSFYIPYI